MKPFNSLVINASLIGIGICVRILHDHSSVAGVHSQALDTLQEKLNDAEASLRLEVEQHRKTKVDVPTYLPTVFSIKLVDSLESRLIFSLGLILHNTMQFLYMCRKLTTGQLNLLHGTRKKQRRLEESL